MTLARTLRAFLALVLLFASGVPVQAMDYPVRIEDKILLEDIAERSFKYFLLYTDRSSGLTRDSSQPGSPASVAASGFYLASLAIAYERGWLTRAEARHRAMTTLNTIWERADHKKGFLYHFLNPRTAKRAWGSEASSIDTALFLAGALFAGEVFQGDVKRLAGLLEARVDWEWMTNGRYLISHGWTPEKGFIPYYWDMYSEHLILQAFAYGAKEHAVSEEVWKEWKRLRETYEGRSIVYAFSGSLFTYQYSHAFIDFRGLRDDGIDYFENSVLASEANRDFSMKQSDRYPGYALAWGLTACLGPAGYVAYGGPPCGSDCRSDGTVAPYGAIGSLPFTPEYSLEAIRAMRSISEKLYTPMGFTDSFNLGKNWFSREYIGIDQGLIVLMIENFLTGRIWDRFMKLPVIERWIEKAKLRQSSSQLVARSSNR